MATNARQLLRDLYEQHGYVRVKMDKRLGGKRTGWEVRLFVASLKAKKQVESCLRALQLPPGRGYAKGGGYVVTLYGKERVEALLKTIRPRVKGEIPQLRRQDYRRLPGRRRRTRQQLAKL